MPAPRWSRPLRCIRCGFENPEGFKFCGGCAQALRPAEVCPSCGVESPSGFKFCGQCASPLGSLPGAAEQLGAEAWHSQLDRFFGRLADLGDFAVKGATGPVRVFELSGVGGIRNRFDLYRAKRIASEGMEIAERIESPLSRAVATHAVGSVLAEEGDPDAGVATAERAVEFTTRTIRSLLPEVMSTLAVLSSERGEPEAARALAERALHRACFRKARLC
jgi:hypothetical protein